MDDTCAPYPLRQSEIEGMTRFLYETKENEENEENEENVENEENEEDWETSLEDLERGLKTLESQLWDRRNEIPEEKKQFLATLFEKIRTLMGQMNDWNYQIMKFLINQLLKVILSKASLWFPLPAF